jgi:transcriptional regulator with GAF, ATPase, and Fis domain
VALATNANLLVRAGPLDGAVFPLIDPEFTLGRDESNALCLEGDRSVSRHHCVIEQRAEEFTIRDLDSANRTYVNDVSVNRQVLQHGDEIRIGRSVFVFLADGQAPPPRGARVDLDEGGAVPGNTVVLRRADAVYLHPEGMVEAAAHSERVARNLKSILQVCQALLSLSRLEDLEKRLLESAFDSIPAQRGAILLRDGSSEDFAAAVYCVRKAGESHAAQSKAFRLPRRIIQPVLDERTALCISDVLNEPDGVPSESIVQAHINSLMAVPLIVGDAIIGVIYLDASDAAVRFSEDDLQLLTGIAEVSAAPLENALKLEQLEHENRRLMEELAGGQALVGGSEGMRRVHKFILKVARSDSTVLLSGSSGTGKELVARAIHRNSSRSGKPFVAINCAAVTETLLESEFFGHEKGSFTGATAQKKGKLEEADGGTVFLDEIGELALSLQAKMLRVLQERELERVGGTRSIRINIRVIAATNRDLEEEIRRGTFRQDLFYRLNVVALKMPDLKERRPDIPLLAHHFLQKHAKNCARRIVGLSEEALACLANYDWPGNVRELENAIERAIVLGSTDRILPEDLPDTIVESGGPAVEGAPEAKFHETIRDFKKQLVTKALEQASGSYVEAAKLLGLHPNNLHRLVKTLNLRG